MEWASSYKYLGLIIDNKLRFDTHVEEVCKKGQQRLHCLRRPSTFNISRTLMTMFVNLILNRCSASPYAFGMVM